jgi:hypothetical protein
MAMTNRERVGKALELLCEGLAPYVERELQEAVRAGAVNMETVRRFTEDPLLKNKPIAEWDAASLLKLIWETWNDVFRKTLGFAERSLVSELREWRNRWAHQEAFSSDDADRALDSAERLLAAVSAPQAEEVRRLKLELRRQVYDEQVRSEKRRLGGSLIESSATSSLKPWREVAVPQPDVTSGRYQQAEFAADLWQVYLGEGSDEYRDPVEFSRRTYLTESLRQLLANAILRLTGQGGDPVVQLQTNFGGGKTHSMLALFHLASGRRFADLPGVERALEEAAKRAENAERFPTSLAVKRVVLVGNRLSSGNPLRKPDGTECARCGVSWPGNWAGARPTSASAKTTSVPLTPAIGCASSSATTVRALSSLTNGLPTPASFMMQLICRAVRSRRSFPLRRRSPNRRGRSVIAWLWSACRPRRDLAHRMPKMLKWATCGGGRLCIACKT